MMASRYGPDWIRKILSSILIKNKKRFSTGQQSLIPQDYKMDYRKRLIQPNMLPPMYQLALQEIGLWIA